MKRKFEAIVTINLIFVFTIVSIPSLVIFAEFANFNRIDESLTYTYSSTTPPIKKELNLNADVGTIDIRYTTQPVDYLVRVDVNIEMAGPNLNGKSYLDFFNIGWDNFTSPVNFTLEFISDMLEDFSNLHKANIIINIMLRTDIIFDINTSIIEGAIELANLRSITVNSLFLSVDKGDINCDFNHCTIEGNITGIVNYGNITLKSYNNQFTQNSKLTLINELGNTSIDIYQYEEFGANITGTASTKTGIIHLIYKDDSPNIGAQFILYNKTTQGAEGKNTWDGFERDYLPLSALCEGQYYNSTDFPAQNNYYFSLFKWDGGDYLWNLYSIPL
ncbi:MAG: hypothetical protein ACFE9I_14690 [Candidatus Hermodarchaeota archaeon]